MHGRPETGAAPGHFFGYETAAFQKPFAAQPRAGLARCEAADFPLPPARIRQRSLGGFRSGGFAAADRKPRSGGAGAAAAGDSRFGRVIARTPICFRKSVAAAFRFHIWYRGRILSAETGWLLQQGCMAIDDECWGDFLDYKRKPEEYQWWVKVRLKDGSTAWALAKGFGNMASC